MYPQTIDRRQMLTAMASSIYAPFVVTRQAQVPDTAFTDAVLRELLPAWSDTHRTILQRALSPANGGRLDAQTVAQLTPAAAGSVDTLMTTLLPIMKKYSRPPISGFQVGAVASGRSGALYAGANLEVPQSGLNQAIHGEQSAVANAFGHRETGITAIAVTAAPCGHCRQFLNELGWRSEPADFHAE